MATFTNRAALSYNGNVFNSNVVTGELVEVLSAIKTSTPDAYTQGEAMTYVINLFNSGTDAFNGLTVTDNLGATPFGTGTVVPLEYVPDTVRYYVDGNLQANPTVTSTNPLTVTGLSLPAGSNGAVVFQATPNAFASPAPDGSITNTATVTGAGLTAPVTAQNTVAAAAAPNLAIEKSVSPTTVAENGTLTYTFLIRNYGSTPITLDGNAIVTDTFDPILDPINVSFNGNAWAQNTNYTYDPATGAFATLPNQIEVPAATYTQDPTTGQYVIEPGTSTLVVSGTV